MDRHKQNGSDSVDNILDELNIKGSSSATNDKALDDILAELGLGVTPKPNRFATSTSSQDGVLSHEQKVSHSTAVFAAITQDQLKKASSAKDDQNAENITATTAGWGSSKVKDISFTGKAAAIKNVEPDKFANETELLSWFSSDATETTKTEKSKNKDKKKKNKRSSKPDEEISAVEETAFSSEDMSITGATPDTIDDTVMREPSSLDEDISPIDTKPAQDASFIDTAEDEPSDIMKNFFAAYESQPQDEEEDILDDTIPPVNESSDKTEDDSSPDDTQIFSVEDTPSQTSSRRKDTSEENPLQSSAFDEPTENEWPEDGSLFDKSEHSEWERTASFRPAANKAEKESMYDTQTYEIDDDDVSKVPTAAFTQEFDATSSPEPRTDSANKSLFVDEMVDDRFRDFFSETVMVEREDEISMTKRRPKKKSKTRKTAVFTGEFSKLEETADQLEEQYADDEFENDYNHPQDADAIEQELTSLKTKFITRTAISAGIGLILLWLALGYSEVTSLPAFLLPTQHPLTFSLFYLVLLLAMIIVNFTTIAAGLAGLISTPTGDSPPAIASVAVLLQGVALTMQLLLPPAQGGGIASATLFGCVTAFLLAFNSLGKFLRADSILSNFQLASAGFDHSAAYILDDSNELAYNITNGLDEEHPMLLISRPTALVKGFMRQSFSPRWSDGLGRKISWILLVVAVVACGIAYFQTTELLTALSAFAATLCIGAPLSSTLVAAMPTILLQRNTSKVGAVVPGWSAIEELGDVNVVMAGGQDLFPPGSIQLHGIKTFNKERIDLAILYAASVLVEGCDTLQDIFLGVIQGQSDMLYKVESLTKEPGRGFTAWVQNNRVVVGNREMMQRHDITPPPIEAEMKYTSQGQYPIYLGVAGKLFAMFVVSYKADEEVENTMIGLMRSGVSLLVTTDDMNISNELIEDVYRLPSGVVKVLGQRELDILEPLTSYVDESDGVMTHIGSFASFIGGMRAAAGCAASERMAGILQLASAALAAILCIVLAVGGGLSTLSLLPVFFYQLAWTVMVSAIPFTRRY